MSASPEELDEELSILPSNNSENPIDPIEGTSSSVITIVDESSNDSASSTPLSTPGEAIVCKTCKGTASLSLFKQKLSTNGGKQEDIFRNYCNTCKDFFGMCSKKVRGTFTFVTEEGRILTNAEKLEMFRLEKRQSSLSRGNSEIIIEETDTSTNDNDKEEPEVKEESELKKKKIQKKPTFGGKRKKTNWSNVTRLKRKKAEREERDILGIEHPVVSPMKSAPTRKKIEKETSKSTSGSRSTRLAASSSTTSKEKKRGRPVKNAPKTVQKPQNVMSIINPTPRNAKDCVDSEAQTDPDMLLKTTYLSDVFEDAMQKTLSERIAGRLQGQPLILKKEFFMMIRTIQEQDALIVKYRAFEEKYKLAIEQFKNFGRTTRLAYSDDLRNIRADMMERKEEFKAHQAEVVSIMKKQRAKYEVYKEEMKKKYDDHKLEMANMQAKVAYLEQEKKYEYDRAEFFLRSRNVFEKERNEAVDTAETAVKNLNDRLWVANNERCAHCQTVEKVRKKMMIEVADMTTKSETAIAERNQAVEKATLFEAAAQKLGKDCDTIKYERDSWKAYAERFKKEVNKLTQTVKEKDKELQEKNVEILSTTPKHLITPKSVVCTPNDNDRVSPPEEGEIVETPPQASPVAVSKVPQKPLAQKVAEKKAALPIAAGFESWIPKDKLDAPAPSIPKARTAFGPPIKTPQQLEAEKAKLGMSIQQTPWEKAAMSTPASDSLSEAIAKVQADAFLGGSSNKQPGYASKSYTEEMNRMMQNRKRTGENVLSEEPKKTNPASIPPQKKTKQTAPQSCSSPYKNSPATPVYSSSSSGPLGPPPSVGSLTNMRKIPKLSDKPPQAEFAPALGIRTESGNAGIPGLDDDDKPEEKETMSELGKIMPAEPKPEVVASVGPKSDAKTMAPQQQAQKKNIVKPPPGRPTAGSNISPIKKPIATPSVAQQNSQKSNKNNQQNLSKKQKKKLAKQWMDHSDASPWHSQSPMNVNPWGVSQQPNAFGIQQPQSSSQGRYPMSFRDDRPWSDSVSVQRNNGRPADAGGNFSALPWHREQDTPFGKVPIRDSFGIGGIPDNRPAPQSFYGQDGGFYSPPHQQQQRRYSPPPPAMRHGYTPPMYSPPPPARNPRSFYG